MHLILIHPPNREIKETWTFVFGKIVSLKTFTDENP